MIVQTIIKFIPALLYSIAFLGLFYWQFNHVYGFIINHFTEEKLSILYGYLFIYLFGIYIVATTLINLLHYLLKTKALVFTVNITLLIFYALSFGEFYHIIDYFIDYPLPSNSIMGMIFFMILTFGYSLYSMVILFFKDFMPLSHIFVLFVLGLGYALYFTHFHCIPLDIMWENITAKG